MKASSRIVYSFICLTLYVLAACTSGATADTTLQPKEFNEQLQSQQGVLLDVRTLGEYSEGHLPDARNIDYKNDSFEDSLGQLDKNKTYFVYCKAGVRSQKAAEKMQEMGFAKVYNLDGGIDAWKKEGMPVKE